MRPQVLTIKVDTNNMSVSGISSVDTLASLASGMASAGVQSDIALAVLNQIQDQQMLMAQALLDMISQTPSLDGTGQAVDVSA